MNAYRALKDQQQKEVNEFPVFFAFSDDQFEQCMIDRGLGVNDLDKIVSIGAGGFILKKDKQAFIDMMKRHEKEREEARKNKDYMYNMFLYELANHEYCVTYDPTDALEALGLTMDDVLNDDALLSAFKKAKADYLAQCEEA